MELDFEPEAEYDNCMFFVKDMQDNNDLCLICMIDETKEGNQWTRYKVRCGHVFHSRCFRRWCGVKQRLNCCHCGDLPEDETSRYCEKCDEFGHNCMLDLWQYGKKRNKKQKKQTHK